MYKIGDLKNSLEILQRGLRGLGISKHDYETFVDGIGHPAEFVQMLRRLLLTLAPEVITDVNSRGCTLASRDKKLVIVAFDILREHMHISPCITVEQFLGSTSSTSSAFIEHKIMIITKIAAYVQNFLKRKPFLKSAPHTKILGFMEDELLQKHLPRTLSFIKNES
jgi:hypothetical protein